MKADYLPVCTAISQGEDYEEFLKHLEAMDPCEEHDDEVFTKRIQGFLKQYERDLTRAENHDITVGEQIILAHSPAIIIDQGHDMGILPEK